MKRKIKYIALALVLCLMLPLAGCGKISGRYRILETLETQSFSIGFRDGDYVQYYVEAALKVLAADGTVQRLAMQWFGEDKTTFSKDISALEKVGATAITPASTSSWQEKCAVVSAGMSSSSLSRPRTPTSSSPAGT